MKRYRHEEDYTTTFFMWIPSDEGILVPAHERKQLFRQTGEELLFSQREVQALFRGAWVFKLLFDASSSYFPMNIQTFTTNSSKGLIVVISAVHQVFPVLMLGKMVPLCPFEVMKGHTTCFGQTYMRSEVFHFPLKTLRVSSQSITFSFSLLPQSPAMVQTAEAISAWVVEWRLCKAELPTNLQWLCTTSEKQTLGLFCYHSITQAAYSDWIQLWIQLLVKHLNLNLVYLNSACTRYGRLFQYIQSPCIYIHFFKTDTYFKSVVSLLSCIQCHQEPPFPAILEFCTLFILFHDGNYSKSPNFIFIEIFFSRWHRW